MKVDDERQECRNGGFFWPLYTPYSVYIRGSLPSLCSMSTCGDARGFCQRRSICVVEVIFATPNIEVLSAVFSQQKVTFSTGKEQCRPTIVFKSRKQFAIWCRAMFGPGVNVLDRFDICFLVDERVHEAWVSTRVHAALLAMISLL